MSDQQSVYNVTNVFHNPPTQQEKAEAPEVMQYFKFAHLPHNLAEISKPFADLAWEMNRTLLDSEQKRFCLQSLLVSKDAAVRAAL